MPKLDNNYTTMLLLLIVLGWSITLKHNPFNKSDKTEHNETF